MYTNISNLNRSFRIVLSLGLVLAVLGMSGPLGVMAYVPFISIYAGITGFIGWDPVDALVNKSQEKATAKQAYVHHGRLVTH